MQGFHKENKLLTISVYLKVQWLVEGCAAEQPEVTSFDHWGRLWDVQMIISVLQSGLSLKEPWSLCAVQGTETGGF